MTEKTIAKLAVRIGDHAHDLAQQHIKLHPLLASLTKIHNAANCAARIVRNEYNNLDAAGMRDIWPDMMADLAEELETTGQALFKAEKKLFGLEIKLENIEDALRGATYELSLNK